MSADRFTVALTGGIASGKTAVAARFAALGAHVIDADRVARELVAAGTPALAEIIATFGADAVDANGELDRPAMRERIFSDPPARSKLESILHPRVRAALRERSASADAPYALLVVPLLAENAGDYAWVDRILVVDAARDTQHRRLLARDGISAGLADSMLDAQAARDERLALADDVIDNSTTLQALDERVRALHAHYLALAKVKRETH